MCADFFMFHRAWASIIFASDGHFRVLAYIFQSHVNDVSQKGQPTKAVSWNEVQSDTICHEIHIWRDK